MYILGNRKKIRFWHEVWLAKSFYSMRSYTIYVLSNTEKFLGFLEGGNQLDIQKKL
jgi:hypothetical protein